MAEKCWIVVRARMVDNSSTGAEYTNEKLLGKHKKTQI